MLTLLSELLNDINVVPEGGFVEAINPPFSPQM